MSYCSDMFSYTLSLNDLKQTVVSEESVLWSASSNGEIQNGLRK